MYFGYIYRFVNRVNGKIYIGQTTDLKQRLSSHKSKSATLKTKFYNAIRKYKWDSFSFIVLRQVQNECIDSLNEILDLLEVAYIEYYDSYNKGYNSTLGGSSKRGYHLSTEFSELCKHRTYSEETRHKMSIAAKNKVVSQGTRDKLSQNAKKRNFSEYAKIYKEKRLTNLRKVKCKRICRFTKDNVLIDEWNSIIEASKALQTELQLKTSLKIISTSICKCCKFKLPSYKGYIWLYK